MITQYCYCWVDNATGEITHMRTQNTPLEDGEDWIEPDDTTGKRAVEFEIDADEAFGFDLSQKIVRAKDLRALIRVGSRGGGQPEVKPGESNAKVLRIGPRESCRRPAVAARMRASIRARLGIDDAAIDQAARARKIARKRQAQTFEDLPVIDMIEMHREIMDSE